MVNQSSRGRRADRHAAPKAPRLDHVFSALADPTRRAILGRLAHGECTVTDLARPFAISLPAVSKHLKVLERAGLIDRRIDGRVHHCRLRPQPLQDAAEWIAAQRAYWEARLDALEDYLLRRTETAEKHTATADKASPVGVAGPGQKAHR